MNQFKTSKGTILPIMNLKGKDYMGVQQRMVWFREEKPDWSIETEFVTMTNDLAVAKATIKDPSGKIVATAHKQENIKGFGDYIEKSETGAIGRALLMCGYGTAFAASELDEGGRLADSPVVRKAATSSNNEDAFLDEKIHEALTKSVPTFDGLTWKQAANNHTEMFLTWLDKLISWQKTQKATKWTSANLGKYKLAHEYGLEVARRGVEA